MMLKSSTTTYVIYNVLIIIIFLNKCVDGNDQTTCMTENVEESDELHFVCYCINGYKSDVRKHADFIADHPGFSLAHFAYNLAGSYFGKTVHIRLVCNCLLCIQLIFKKFQPKNPPFQ